MTYKYNTADEAREAIKAEFINGYYDFIENDIQNGETNEFARKYGFKMTEEGIKNHQKDTAKNMIWYQQHVSAGRYLPQWKKAGFSEYAICDLHHEGFLSYDFNGTWRARQLGQSDWYFISQKTARTIYKEMKRK